MNVKIIFAIVVFVVAIIAAQPVGISFAIVSYELGQDSNGYQVMAQVQFDANGKVVCVVIGPEAIADGSANVRFMHEMGHMKNSSWSEAQCDDFANSFGVGHVEDAYHNGR